MIKEAPGVSPGVKCKNGEDFPKVHLTPGEHTGGSETRMTHRGLRASNPQKSGSDFADRTDMDGMSLPILIAVVTVLVAFTIWQVVKGLMDPDKRKLKERLSTEGPRS